MTQLTFPYFKVLHEMMKIRYMALNAYVVKTAVEKTFGPLSVSVSAAACTCHGI